MRKSSVTSRSSLPSGALSCQTTSAGFASSAPRSLPCTPLLVPSRCLRKYSWPLPLTSRGCSSARRTCCAASCRDGRGRSQLIFSEPSLQRLDGVVLRVHAGRLRIAHDLQRIGLQLRRGRQPAHALGAHVVVDHAAAIQLLVGERRDHFVHAELFVAPLVGVRVEEAGAVHLARRADPVEREGERRPAGLRAQLFLAHVVRPAAAALADAAAHHQHVDDAAVVHVAVVPVVHRRRR